MSPPPTYSPKAKDDAKVLSRRTAPGRGEAPDAVKGAPEGETSTAGHTGEQTPMDTNNGGHIQLGPHPDSIPETDTAPESGAQPPSKEGVCIFRR